MQRGGSSSSMRFAPLVLIAALPTAGATLRASAVRVDITPESPQWLMGYNARQSTGVHDHIFHRVVGLESGGTQVFLVSS